MVKVLVSKEEYDNVKALEKAVICYKTSWDEASLHSKGAFDQLSEIYKNTDLQFYIVDVEKFQAIAKDEGIQVLPTFLFFKRGERVDAISGANTNILKDKIKLF